MSELRVFSFNFAPRGWAQCNGQFLPINQNQALFALLGTTYGGNGQTTFALPNLRGQVPIHQGNGFSLGQTGGQESHTVTLSEMPTHLHQLQASSLTTDGVPTAANDVLGQALNLYRPPTGSLTTMEPSSVSSVGGSQPHANLQPYLVLNICIALTGIFPSQN